MKKFPKHVKFFTQKINSLYKTSQAFNFKPLPSQKNKIILTNQAHKDIYQYSYQVV